MDKVTEKIARLRPILILGIILGWFFPFVLSLDIIRFIFPIISRWFTMAVLISCMALSVWILRLISVVTKPRFNKLNDLKNIILPISLLFAPIGIILLKQKHVRDTDE
jgi:protein-S-isoprenylcysteine O-methyltransferase Ste14